MSDSVKVEHELLVPEDLAGERLDKALALLLPDYSRSRLSQWLKQGWVLLDDELPRQRTAVIAGQRIMINAELQVETKAEAEPIALNVVYEDEALIIINKPQGLVVHPGSGNSGGTLVNALLNHDAELEKLPRAGLVHRLDKDTTGLLIIARTVAAHTALVAMLQRREISREYETLVRGQLISGRTIDAAIERHPTQRTRMAVREDGKPAVTHFRVLERFNGYTRLRVKLETGRTHQIRVHMAHIGHPIVGDQSYGGRLQFKAGASDLLRDGIRGFRRQALHARRLSLQHPTTGEHCEWNAPVPADMTALLELIRNEAGRASYD